MQDTLKVSDAAGNPVPGLFMVSDENPPPEDMASLQSYTKAPMNSKSDMADWHNKYTKELLIALRNNQGLAQAYKKDAPVICKWLLQNFDQLTAYKTSSDNEDAAMVFEYRPDKAAKPSWVYIEGGLIFKKC